MAPESRDVGRGGRGLEARHAADAADLGVGEALLEPGHDAELGDHVLEVQDLGLELPAFCS